MKIARIGFLVCFLAATSLAQTPQEEFARRYGIGPGNTTGGARVAPSPSDYRMVGGRAYVPSRSPQWKPFKATCLKFTTNGIVAQEIEIKRIYGAPMVSESQSVGAYSPGPAPRRLLSEERIVGKKFLLVNCPASLHPSSGKEINGTAMQTGTMQIGEDVLEIWDCGTPYNASSLVTPPKPVSPEVAAGQKKAADSKVLEFTQEQAIKGNSTYQLRLAKRYAEGDGVPKDITKARAWISAAGTNDPAAATALLKAIDQ